MEFRRVPLYYPKSTMVTHKPATEIREIFEISLNPFHRKWLR